MEDARRRAADRDDAVDPARALVLGVFTLGLALAFIALLVVDQVSASTF